MDYYQILEVDKAASPEVIKRAYRVLSMKYHPDRAPEVEGDTDQKMRLLNEAYGILSDPVRRSSYDNSRATWDVWLNDGVLGLARNWLQGLNQH